MRCSSWSRLVSRCRDLCEQKGTVINAGNIYQRYKTIASERGDTVLSDRRISDHLKQLEHLNLISAEYQYVDKKQSSRSTAGRHTVLTEIGILRFVELPQQFTPPFSNVCL